MKADAISGCLIAAAVAAAGCAAAPETVRPAFPATHVTLYDCGLAQIERQAAVEGATTLSIDVQHAHLDDMLSTLVLATDGTVDVSGVSFPGVQNLGQAVASSGFASSMLDGSGGLELPADMEGYARALVGTHVRVETGAGDVVEGTVLDAVVPPGPVPGEGEVAPPPEPIMVVVTTSGALRWLPIGTVAEVSPTSTLESSAIENFATALGQASGFAETSVELTTTAGSAGRLAASYVRQIPVWRMLYKTSVEEGEVVLEAWAVVHNDTAEGWEDVSMTLVSGLPSSYVFSVASPRYQYREVVEAPGATGEMMPQLGAQTPDSLLYEWDIYHGSSGSYGMGGIGHGGSGYGYGYGTGAGALSSKSGSVAYGSEMPSSLLSVGESAAEETMVAQVEQEISTYTSMSTVSLPGGASSMVPLIRRELPGQAFTLVAAGKDPATCVRIENTTGLVLQPGMSTFYIDGRFRGQAGIDRLEPGDVRVLCYGRDQDILASRGFQADEEHTALEFKHDDLWIHSLRTTTFTWDIESFAGLPRDLAIEVTHIANGRVVSPDDLLDTDVPTRVLHPFTIAPRSETERIIVVEEGIMSRTPLTTERFDALIEADTLPGEQVAVLEEVRPTLAQAEEREARYEELRAAVAEIEEDIRWQKDLLAEVPDTGGKSKSVDAILARIVKDKAEADALREDMEELAVRIEELMEEAKSRLAATLPPPVK
jgi:hypothetical protein